ncbi:MAG TPA: hypothetical protein VFW11_21090 [Cyclobacteriaceae bacterium]|nr:hypothetical protein [Cyclobacteriaceae bacterium]
MKTIGLILVLLFLNVARTLAQKEDAGNSIWGKLALAQNFPNPVIVGETATIGYRARDVNYVSIAMYDETGKRIHLYEDLYPGIGQIRIGKDLDPGRYTYALFVNGRMVKKRTMEVVRSESSAEKYPLRGHDVE